MSTNGKVSICTASNPTEMTRPLSTYDNLNTNDTKPTNISNNTHNDANHANQSNQSVIESPFNGITFRFDEIKQPQYDGMPANATNGYDNISNSEYEQHRSQHSNGITTNRGNQVTTIAQNHLLEAVDAIVTPQRSIMKPVHSEAKSQFLGLNVTNGDNVDGHDNTSELTLASEDQPLLNKLNGNRSILLPTNRQQSSIQYQNLPNNSACYGQNQIIDANEACACKAMEHGIRSMHSDRYECDRCNEFNNNVKRMENPIPTTSADANAANSTITHVASSSYRMSESLSQVIMTPTALFFSMLKTMQII